MAKTQHHQAATNSLEIYNCGSRYNW